MPWKREWLPIPVFLPGEFHGERSLVGYSPWGCKELDMTEWSDQHFHFFTSRLDGRSSGPGTKLGEEWRQNKCLSNNGPKTRGPFWASCLVQILKLWCMPKGGEETYSSSVKTQIEFLTSPNWSCVVQQLSSVQLFVSPWTATYQASLSFTISRSLLKLISIESVMPSNHLILCHPLLLLPSIFHSIRVFANESAFHIRWPKYWSFSFSITPSNEYSGLIFFRIDWFDLLAVPGTL